MLPGEIMKVFILKEGKEYNQGVAYLDDGTMVVVDNARKMIGKTVDISVTSVLQTTAGKMIFGKFDERGQTGMAKPEMRPPDLRKSNPQPASPEQQGGSGRHGHARKRSRTKAAVAGGRARERGLGRSACPRLALSSWTRSPLRAAAN